MYGIRAVCKYRENEIWSLGPWAVVPHPATEHDKSLLYRAFSGGKHAGMTLLPKIIPRPLGLAFSFSNAMSFANGSSKL